MQTYLLLLAKSTWVVQKVLEFFFQLTKSVLIYSFTLLVLPACHARWEKPIFIVFQLSDINFWHCDNACGWLFWSIDCWSLLTNHQNCKTKRQTFSNITYILTLTLLQIFLLFIWMPTFSEQFECKFFLHYKHFDLQFSLNYSLWKSSFGWL